MHLYTDVLEGDQPRTLPKQKYYSIDEYLSNQKQMLLCDVKSQLVKLAPSVIDRFREHKGSTYSLVHRSRLKKFFALEYHRTYPDFVDKKSNPQTISQADLLLIFNQEDPS